MSLKKIAIPMAMIALLVPLLTFAADFKTGDNVFLAEPVNDDFYAVGGMAQIESDVNGDLMMVGGQLLTNSMVAQDLGMIGGDLVVRGEVRDDARLVGGNVRIDGTIKNDLLVAGGTIELSDTAQVGNDLMMAGGDVTINGRVEGNIVGSVGTLYLNSTVKGDVRLLGVGKLVFGPRGKILGNLTYKSREPSQSANETTVTGIIDYQPTKKSYEAKGLWAFGRGLSRGFPILRFLTLLLTGLFFVWLLHFYAVQSATTGLRNPLKSLGIGFVLILLVPLAALLFAVTGIGLSLAGILMLFWILALIFGKLTLAMIIGIKLIPSDNKSGFWRLYGAFALGALIFSALGLIPMIGWLLKFLALLLGVGALALYEWELFLFLRKGKKI